MMLLDLFADAVNPLLMLALFVVIVREERGIGRISLLLAGAILAIGLTQQVAKWAQRAAWVSAEFPSTHFAVHLSVLTILVILRPHLWPLCGVAVFYGALMLWQNYHTPLEMLGSFYAVPLSALIFGCFKFARNRLDVTSSHAS